MRCLDCGTTISRAVFQDDLAALNPGWSRRDAATAPDGDADLEIDTTAFHVPDCPACGAAGQLRKVFGSVGITFKGSGFYKTDSRGGSSSTSASKPESSESKSETKSESKSDSSSSSSSSSSSTSAA